jgi:hypothetical protein
MLRKRVPEYVFASNGRQMHVNERRPPLMKELGSFINRCNPSGWIWQPVPRSSSVWMVSPGQGFSFAFAVICVHFVSVGRGLKPAGRAPNLRSIFSNAVIVAASIRDILIRMAA